jgi:hypothetical protein
MLKLNTICNRQSVSNRKPYSMCRCQGVCTDSMRATSEPKVCSSMEQQCDWHGEDKEGRPGETEGHVWLMNVACACLNGEGGHEQLTTHLAADSIFITPLARAMSL